VNVLQVMSDPAGGMTFVVDPKKPVGGHVMAHASTQRIYMRKGKAEQRVAKVRWSVPGVVSLLVFSWQCKWWCCMLYAACDGAGAGVICFVGGG
jgi:hypothetical protein